MQCLLDGDAYGLAAAGPVLGLGVYSAYVYGLTGDPLMWVWVQKTWGRPTQNPILVLFAFFGEMATPLNRLREAPHEVLNGAAAVSALTLAVFIARKVGIGYGVWTAAGVLSPLTVGGLQSMGRYTSIMFPIFAFCAATLSGTSFRLVVAIFMSYNSLWPPYFLRGAQCFESFQDYVDANAVAPRSKLPTKGHKQGQLSGAAPSLTRGPRSVIQGEFAASDQAARRPSAAAAAHRRSDTDKRFLSLPQHEASKTTLKRSTSSTTATAET